MCVQTADRFVTVAALVAIHGHALAVQLEDLARAARHGAQRLALGAGEAIAHR